MRYWRMLMLLAAGVPLPAAAQNPPPSEPPGTNSGPKPPPSPRRCAIPLRNVLKPSFPAPSIPDPMIIVPRDPEKYSKREVQAPAPSCDDLRKDDAKK